MSSLPRNPVASVAQVQSKRVPSEIGVRVKPQKSRRRLSLGQLARHAFLLGIVAIVVLPFVWMALGSFKTYGDLINRPGLPPEPFTMANYEEVFAQAGFASALANSLFVAVGRVIFACATSVILGYIFAKYRFFGRETIFLLLLSTMLIPFAAILVPLYLTMSKLQLLDSVSGLVVISLFSTFGVFLLRQWISSIPDAYMEAARVDGASEWWIIWRIIVPLSGPPLAALAIFTFLGSWDDFLLPSIVLTDPQVKTVPLALNGLKSLFLERYEIFAAGAMITVVPVMVLYTFMQKHFVRGLTFGGIKE